MLSSREAGPSGFGGGTGTCRHPQPMRSAWCGSRAAVWRFCARPGLLVLRVWPGGSDRAGGCRLSLGGGQGGLGSSREGGGPPAWDTAGAEIRSPGGWAAFVYCAELGRSLGFCPRPPGDAGWWGGGAAGGCLEPRVRALETIAGVSRPLHLPPGGRGCSGGPHCLEESEAGGARAPEGRRPPRLPGLRGGGPGQLWALGQWVEAVRPSPQQPPWDCMSARCFWRESGGGGVDCRALPAREGRGHPGGPLAPPIPPLPTRAGSRVWRGSRRFEKARGAEGRGQGPEQRACSDWPGPQLPAPAGTTPMLCSLLRWVLCHR